MTTLEITTTPPTTVHEFAQSMLAIGAAIDCRCPACAPINHTAMAQLVADEDYDAVMATTHDGQLAASAYHVAYQRYVRQHLAQGAGPLCNCDLCQSELGGAQ